MSSFPYRDDRTTPTLAPTGLRGPIGWVAAASIGLHGLLAWLLRAPMIATGNDDAVYLLLARALREGHYRELFYVGMPTHSQYPPAYPGLLALLGAPGDGAIGLVIAVNILLSCAALALVFDVMRRWSPPLALAAVSVLALNPSLIEAAGHVQSEPMFMLATLLALWALRPAAPARHRSLAIAAAVIAALTRSAGITVIIGVLAFFAFERDWKRLAILAVAALLTVGPWLTWTVMAPEKVVGRSYIADALVTARRAGEQPDSTLATRSKRLERAPGPVVLARTLAQRVGRNVPRYITRALPSELAIPTVPGTPADNLVWLSIMIVALAAGAIAAWTYWRAALLVTLAYGGLLMVWPYVVNRFLAPLLPVLVMIMLLGAWRLGVRLLPHAAALVPALIVAAIPLGGGARAFAEAVSVRTTCPPEERTESGLCAGEAPRYRRAVAAIEQMLEPGARVFTTKEGTFYYWTGHQVVPLYVAVRRSAAELETYLTENDVAMVFLPHLKEEEGAFGVPLSELCEGLTPAPSDDPRMLLLWTRPPAEGEPNACETVARWRATWE